MNEEPFHTRVDDIAGSAPSGVTGASADASSDADARSDGTDTCTNDAYARAGVNIAAGQAVVDRLRRLVDSTGREGVVGGIGGFAGLFQLPGGATLVSACDGVGTKLKLAAAFDRHDTVGIDCVAMCVNDLLCTGAEPLFFLDYLASGRLDPARVEQVVAGVAAGCREAGCALLGGETAEMPGMYAEGDYDLAGFAVGWLPPGQAPLDGARAAAGDAVVGLASSGLHSNGYSLVRRLLADDIARLTTREAPHSAAAQAPRSAAAEAPHSAAAHRVSADNLLTPTRIYVKSVRAALTRFDIRAMSHITGGGLVDNPPRMLPSGLAVRLQPGSWPEPPIFDVLRQRGALSDLEMRRTFNLGLGFLLVLPGAQAADACRFFADHGLPAWPVGTVVPA